MKKLLRSGFFLCDEFSALGDKKKRAGESNKGILEILFFNSSYFEKNKVRSRQI